MFGLLKPILHENAGLITFQDLAFKIDFPNKRAGVFSFWGLGSTDQSGSQVEKEPIKMDTKKAGSTLSLLF